MHYGSLDAFLTEGRPALAKGPVAIILAEDAVEVETTLRHHLAAGFAEVLLLAHPELARRCPTWWPRSTASTMTSMPKTRWSMP